MERSSTIARTATSIRAAARYHQPVIEQHRQMQLAAVSVFLSALAFACLLIPERLAVTLSILLVTASAGVALVIMLTGGQKQSSDSERHPLLRASMIAPLVVVFLLFLGWGTHW